MLALLGSEHVPLHLSLSRQAWGQIFLSRAPIALIPSQRQFQSSTFKKEAMLDPVFGVRLSIQLGALDVDVLVVGVEVDIANGSFLAGELVGERNFFEEGRCDEVDVLAGVGEDTLQSTLAWC